MLAFILVLCLTRVSVFTFVPSNCCKDMNYICNYQTFHPKSFFI